MAETTRSAPAEVDATEAQTSSPELAPAPKVTRARATASGVPRQPAAPRVTAVTVAPDRPANVSIYQGGADSVAGDAVTITQGGASIVNARTVDVRQGGIANAQAEDIHVSMGGVALARADRVSVEMGGLGIAFAREAQLTQGGARTVIAQDVRVDQGLIGTAFAGKVTFERPSGVFLLLAGRTEGPVKALLDWRGALAFGAAMGAIVGLLRRR
jgi:hypothetical protein